MPPAARLPTLISLLIAHVALGAPSDAPKKDRTRPTEGSLKVGQEAPDFELVLLKDAEKKENAKKTGDAPADAKGKKDDEPAKVKLSTLRGSKPVLLIFGSYT